MSEGKLDRRGFLAGAAGLTGVALTVGAWKPVFAMEAAAPGMHEAEAANKLKVGAIALTLDEQPAGALLEAEGGSAFTDVLESESTGSLFIRKLPGTTKWGNITLKRGITSDTTIYNWLRDVIGGKTVSHNGSIMGAAENFKVFTRTDFFNALLTEVGFPALDAASKDAAKMTIKFQPESTRLLTGSGGSISPTQNFKTSSVSNFKLTINGMNTSFVTKIDTINIKMNYASAESERQPRLASIDIPNMKITVPESQAKDFFSWHEDFVIKGNNSSENEKTGSLSFLSSDMKTEFFRLDLSGLGIFALDPDPLTLTNSIRHVTAQLYCDKMIFNFKL